MVKISVLTFFIAFPADIRSCIQREYESHMSRPLKWSWAWRCLQFLCAGDQGWCGSIYEFLKFPICIPYQITSSLAIIFCFGGRSMAFSSSHLKTFPQEFLLAFCQAISFKPVLRIFLLLKIATYHPARPVFTLFCLILPQHLCMATSSCPSPGPYTHACFGSLWNDETQKRGFRVFYIRYSPLYTVTPCPEWTIYKKEHCRFKMQNFSWHAQFSRQFTFETAK